MRHWLRLITTAVTVAATIAASTGAALAAPAHAGTSKSVTGVLHATSSTGCGWVISIKVTPVYDSNGRLEKVFSSAASKVTCSSDVADFIYNTASIEKNGVVVKTGKTSSCTKSPCTLTYSSISWTCIARPGGPDSYFFCDGYYRGEGHFTITLNSKYIWTSPPAKGCTIHHDAHIITCTEYSPSEYVPETN